MFNALICDLFKNWFRFQNLAPAAFLHGQDVCNQVGANQRMKTFGCLFSRSRSMFITILIYNDLMIYMNLSTCISFFHEMN